MAFQSVPIEMLQLKQQRQQQPVVGGGGGLIKFSSSYSLSGKIDFCYQFALLIFVERLHWVCCFCYYRKQKNKSEMIWKRKLMKMNLIATFMNNAHTFFYAFTTLTIKYVRWKRLSSVYIPFFFLQLVKLSQVTRIWRHHYINFFFSEHCWQTDSH